ncbi:hypothetical protein GCM10022406_25380 [Hymenobacter algoricola]|uniref:Peptidoglycan-binding protein n=1 Tax=Hymenobacter algoricola TaxID=486267 RepID=A0ABP7N9C4_9BACT
MQWSAAHLYVREATGRNDGPLIDTWARANGVPLRSPWCGLTQWAGQKACGLPVPKGAAGSYNWFLDPKRTYYVRGKRGSVDSLRAGHQVGFYYANLGRIGHIGRGIVAGRTIRKGRPVRGWYVNAGNTGAGGGRDGAGIRLVYYALPDFYACANWLW